jgi:hypothetical protein
VSGHLRHAKQHGDVHRHSPLCSVGGLFMATDRRQVYTQLCQARSWSRRHIPRLLHVNSRILRAQLIRPRISIALQGSLFIWASVEKEFIMMRHCRERHIYPK